MDRVRGSWEEREGLHHAVELEGKRLTARRFSASAPTTDCGIPVPYDSSVALDAPVTCEDCLFGPLDGTLRTFGLQFVEVT